MSVGKKNGADVLPIFEEIRDVGDNDIDAQELGFGEHEAGIDNDDVVSPADGHAVHAELAHSAERNYVKFSF
jgi:hypothetical protein